MKAKKSFGQHFLIQESIAEKLASSVVSDGCSAIVEVGPGKGILTKYLLRQSLPVFAVELDRDMIPLLKKEFSGTSLHIVEADILRVRFDQLLGADTDFVLVGNFPYNISSQIIFLGIQHRHHVPFMAGMFQREMAERICSPPGSKSFGVISVLTQAFYRPVLLFHVKPGSFSPPPKVQSSVISLTRYRSDVDDLSFQVLRQVVKVAFSQRRKKLRNTLGPIINEDILKEHGVSDMRPEQLSVEQFIALARVLASSHPT
ncbi:MAG: ribosomal RNA small subunit methyltransferase A [Saprospiraceae bacterium]|uniref:Ribosomal RNA small subunit methyltransferase A n=1 Tax=Candidatus Opimibacter skivensis TaxID=2982028 RepID=A0A9D7SVG0_9BACT|nr:ribosomal RNA small subunit methyltransferase A [Candidatus Opimibacter skivensis]